MPMGTNCAPLLADIWILITPLVSSNSFYVFLRSKRQKTDQSKQQRLDTFFAPQHGGEKSVTESVATGG